MQRFRFSLLSRRRTNGLVIKVQLRFWRLPAQHFIHVNANKSIKFYVKLPPPKTEQFHLGARRILTERQHRRNNTVLFSFVLLAVANARFFFYALIFISQKIQFSVVILRTMPMRMSKHSLAGGQTGS